MKIKQISIKQYILEENEVEIIKWALDYCRHRIEKHNKCLHLSLDKIKEMIDQFYE